MKKFSEKILERKNFDSISLLQSEINEYTKRMNRKIPEEVNDVIHLLSKYKIDNKEYVEMIKNNKSSDIKKISKELNVPETQLVELSKMLVDLKTNIRLLPHYQTEAERQAIMAGKMAQDDLTMDLESKQGRDAVAKQYMPLVMKIVNQFKSKSSLAQDELLSAGTMGLTYAMNTYRKPEDQIDKDFKDMDDVDKKEGKKAKGLTFKQYAGWCIRNQILTDINTLSHTVKLGQYYYQKIKDTDGKLPSNMSIDKNIDGEDINVDRFAELATDTVGRSGESKEWKKIFKIIDDKFSKRDASIFYKAFGMNGQKLTQGKQIAKEFGVSAPTVTVVIKNIIKFLKSNPDTREVLSDIMDMYSEALLIRLYDMDKMMIQESILNDDLYILLEEATRWRDKSLFNDTVASAIEKVEDDTKDEGFINDCLTKSFDFIDVNYRTHKDTIVTFLSYVYPTERMADKSDLEILKLMDELIEVNSKYKLTWKK